MPDGAAEVVVYGTVCLDIFVRVDAEGRPVGAPVEMPGGEAFNTATALVGWGIPIALTGTAIGCDPESERLRRLLDDPALGFSRALIPDGDDAVTPVCTIRVFPDGERQMSGRGFAQAVPPPPLAPEILAARPILAIDPNLGQSAVAAVHAAADAGCRIVAMDFGAHPDVLARAEIAVTSREWLWGEAPAEAARRFHALGARRAIVTCGPDGGVGVDADGRAFAFSAVRPAARILDTTGCGDIFRAGLCFGLLKSWGLQRSAEFAARAAAEHATVLGGGSRPRLEKIVCKI